jgi:hypothetical protein
MAARPISIEAHPLRLNLGCSDAHIPCAFLRCRCWLLTLIRCRAQNCEVPCRGRAHFEHSPFRSLASLRCDWYSARSFASGVRSSSSISFRKMSKSARESRLIDGILAMKSVYHMWDFIGQSGGY